jgi:hypothetical protein
MSASRLHSQGELSSKASIHQQDFEASLLDLLHGEALPLANFPHEALPTGMHHAAERCLSLLAHGEVVAHVDERVALEEQLGLPERARELGDGELLACCCYAGQAAELEDECLEH